VAAAAERLSAQASRFRAEAADETAPADAGLVTAWLLGADALANADVVGVLIENLDSTLEQFLPFSCYLIA
jgi:hypothetical protein